MRIPTLSVAVFLCISADLLAADVTKVEVYPHQVTLASKRSRVHLVVTGIQADGQTHDLTREAEYASSDEMIVSATNSVAVPHGDGEAKLTVRVGDQTVAIPVTVSNQSKPDPIRFKYETLAVLTKQGCNAGSCHGSPQGKGGFSLSLFAYDPAIDERSLVRDGFNRRTNIYEPSESLMLKKPMLRIPHVGGKRILKSDVAYQIINDWIQDGARGDPEDAPTCTKIMVHPGPTRVLRLPDRQQQLSVLAHFDDGSLRDVTRIATYDTSHDEVANADANGLVTGKDRGHAAITIRYLEHLESVYFTVIHNASDFEWPKTPEHNYVDHLVNKRLWLLQYAPSPICSDEVFVRRVYLDLTGLLPSAEKAREFLASDSPNKRAELIDRLIDSDQFAHFQTLRMADLLRINPEKMKDGRAKLFADWVADAVTQNTAFDELARSIITATGDAREIPAANFFTAIPRTEDVTEATTQIFMGSRIQCAKCHNHPFENWTQNDYYSIGAVFHRLRRDNDVISVAADGEMIHPTSGQAIRPWGIADSKLAANNSGGGDRRDGFAKWLTRPDNPFFARVEVNRILAHLLGRGIVDPIDDFRSSNPPSNVELLDELAADFVRSGYDRKHIFRVICNSQTYQRATETNRQNENDDELFSHARVRLLSAEQLNDAIAYVTGAVEPVHRIQQTMDKLRVELDQTTADLRSKQPNWEMQQRGRMTEAAYWHGGWWTFGPTIVKDQKTAHDTVLDQEKKLIDVDVTGWDLQKDWRPGQKHDLEVKRRPAVLYVYHPIYANRKSTLRLTFTADDGMKLWHDGKLVYGRIQVVQDGKNTKDIELHEGLNHLVGKVTNGGGAYHFTLRIDHVRAGEDDDPKLVSIPGYAASILGKSADARTDAEHAMLAEHYFAADGRVPKMRTRLDNGGRFDFATQRPYPEQTDFLKAFGQPKRETPCACERLGEPTLEQALQLLNGRKVTDQVAQSVKRFAPFDDAGVIQELYIAAFSRLPAESEMHNAAAHLAASQDREAAIRDLVWAIVNTQEFMFQH